MDREMSVHVVQLLQRDNQVRGIKGSWVGNHHKLQWLIKVWVGKIRV